MFRPPLRRSLLAAGVAVTTALGVLGVIKLADASHGGSGSVLSSSNGTNTIRFAGGATIDVPDGVTDASWAPDGSRAAFVAGDGSIATVRYNEDQFVWYVTDPGTGQRDHPTWSMLGSGLVWAQRDSGADPWRLEAVSNSGTLLPWTISPDDGFHYTHPDGGPGALLVFQRQANSGGTPTGTPSVWSLDRATGESGEVIANASNPAISPDGERVAFVRSDGTNNQIFTSDLSGGDVVQVTSTATAKNNPVWSHDGATIAFNTGTGGSVATAPAGGGNPTTVGGLTGLPSYQTRNQDRVVRLAGANRFATSVAVSAALWATAGDAGDDRVPARSVVLSRSDTFADALGGTALAAAKEGPLLLTPPTSLHPATRAEIDRVLGGTGTVYLLGSTGAISTAVENEIEGMGLTVERLAGSDRFATSVAIANEINPNPDLVLAATGRNFPDALAAGAAAGSYNVPGSRLSAVVVLTSDTTLPASVKSYLDNVSTDPDATIFGIGQGAAATRQYGSIPLVGVNRYETALLVAFTFFDGERISGVSTGVNWPDALSGGALLATLNGPLLLTPPGNTLSLEAEVMLDLRSGSISTGVIFGGTGAVAAPITGQVGRWISGPGGFSTATNPTALGTRQAGPTALQAPATADGGRHKTPEQIKDAAEKATSDRVTEELRGR